MPGSININHRDIVVDLDGTLSHVDALHEDFFVCLRKNPLRETAGAVFGSGSKAAMKRSLAKLAGRDTGRAPLHAELVSHLSLMKQSGKSLHLVTASDQYHADAMGKAVNIFDSVTGSDGARNLKGPEKASYLKERFPEGFIYAGDSAADLPVWMASSGAILVGGAKRHAGKLQQNGVPIVDIFGGGNGAVKDWLRLFRLHQWAKNILIFVPLLLGQLYGQPEAVSAAIMAFLFWSIAGSGSYIVNDIFDVEADRKHRSKCNRPIASGKIGVSNAFVIAAAMICVGVAGAMWLSVSFGMALLWYLVVTLSYSFKLKTVPLLDVGIIAMLFTSRIVAGSLLLALPHSPWLTSFAMLLFLSLALAKRHAELVMADPANGDFIPGRGYRRSDSPLTLALGLGAAMSSIVVMLLFITLEASARGVYAAPEALFVTPVVLLFWFMRIWLLSNRGELDDDPVIFALKDSVSLGLAGILLAGFVLSIVSF
ncbi:UbiA family prenyltransferase [Sphingopyxis kveilinensis]|uniref:UbiA family prenyltransferase n=1 Tax=Sphingopyxis kveilinensis TaxID=3114367 RepID=UPI0030D0C4E6